MFDFPEQLEITDPNELRTAIDNAKTKKDMDALRMAVVKMPSGVKGEILEYWQDKFWKLRRCPTCGRIKGDIDKWKM
jgi:hypothetical protein